MQPSEDIVILDKDDTKLESNSVATDTNVTVVTNQSNVNFDEILNASTNLVQSGSSKKQNIPENNASLLPKIPKVPKISQNNVNKFGVTPMNDNKQDLIYIIQKYQSSERFGEYLKYELQVNYSSAALEKKTYKDLQEILSKIRLHLDNRNLNKLYDGILLSSTVMIEHLSKPIANVDGFHTMLFQNEEFLNCFERMKCDTVMPTIPSHLQLLFILAQTYFMAYSINKTRNHYPEAQEIVDEVEKEFELEQINQNEHETQNDDVSNEAIQPNVAIGSSI